MKVTLKLTKKQLIKSTVLLLLMIIGVPVGEITIAFTMFHALTSHAFVIACVVGVIWGATGILTIAYRIATIMDPTDRVDFYVEN